MRYRGPAFRAHDPRWAWLATSGEGARIHGGRFNAKGTAALYLALDWTTAVLEASQGFGHRLIPPITIVSYEIDCDEVEDLTDGTTLRRLGVNAANLDCEWLRLAKTGEPVPSWEIAERLMRNSVGIIVPSFAPGAALGSKNLVLWRWGDDLPYQVKTFNPRERLPRDDSSWRP